MLIFEDCANSALPARFFPLPRRFFLRRNGAGCFRRHVSYAPKGRCDMRRRLRRSAGHIFSAPEWRVVPPAAHSFLSCQKRMGRKEALENEIALTRLKRHFVSAYHSPMARPVRNALRAAVQSGFLNARYTVRVVLFAPVEYLTYGSRKASSLQGLRCASRTNELPFKLQRK